MKRGLTAQDINTWNKKVKRAAEQGVYIGERVTRRSYNAMSAAQKSAITRKIHTESGKKIADRKTKTLGNIKVDVKVLMSEQKKIQRETARRKAFEQKLDIKVKAGDFELGNVNELKNFGKVVATPQKPRLQDYTFKSIKEFKRHLSNFGSDYKLFFEEYKNEFLKSIEHNITAYIPPEQRQEFYDIMYKISKMDSEKWLMKYLSSAELSIENSYAWFYSMKYTGADERDIQREELTKEYFKYLKEVYA